MVARGIRIKDSLWRRIKAMNELRGESLNTTINFLLKRGLDSFIFLDPDAQAILNELSSKRNVSPSCIASELIIKGYQKELYHEMYIKSIKHKQQQIKKLKFELKKEKEKKREKG